MNSANIYVYHVYYKRNNTQISCTSFNKIFSIQQVNYFKYRQCKRTPGHQWGLVISLRLISSICKFEKKRFNKWTSSVKIVYGVVLIKYEHAKSIHISKVFTYNTQTI